MLSAVFRHRHLPTSFQCAQALIFNQNCGLRLVAVSRPWTRKNFSTARISSNSPKTKQDEKEIQDGSSSVYRGPLTRTFRSLKIFSLSSLGLATALTPFMFVIETSLPFVARVALASTALLTSGVSTALVGWCGAPYVASLRAVGTPGESSVEGIRMETYSLTLRPRYTTVYDTAFLSETKRPFAKWELAESVTLSEAGQAGEGEETVAETSDAKGTVLGRWIVTWDTTGLSGRCRAEGQIQKYFNVHEELLPLSLR